MSYIDIDIVDVALMCGLDIKNSTLGSEEVEARCPYCQDYKYRMYISGDRNNPTFFCHNCGTAGNAVTLYARWNPHGVILSNQEAYADLVRNPSINSDFSPYRDKLFKQKQVPQIKPIHERSRIYLELLNLLKLSSEHKNNLLKRGLSEQMISGNMYRTLPTSLSTKYKIAATLADKFDLTNTPGFFTKNEKWKMAGRSGILIPVCDTENKIQGLQIRLDDESKRKYQWFSSPSRYYENGTAISGYIHISGDTKSNTLHITEGPLKADAASYLSGGELFIGVTGVQNLRDLEECVRKLNPSKIIECFDMDKTSNIDVLRASEKLRSICKPLCSEYIQFIWNREYKGIDDYLNYLKQQNIA